MSPTPSSTAPTRSCSPRDQSASTRTSYVHDGSIVDYTEEMGLERMPKLPKKKDMSIGEAVTKESVDVAKALKASYLIAFSETGLSAG